MESAPIAPALPSSELIAVASHSYLTAVAHLTVGQWLLKYPFSEKGGAPQRRFLWYGVDDVDGDCLFWGETERKKRVKSRSFPLRAVTGVLEGSQTQALKKALDDKRMDETALPHCFSIVTGRRTLDLQANSLDERDHFIASLHCVMTHKQLNRKQQAVALATARRNSIAATHAIAGAVNSPMSPLANPLTAKKDLFVISVKARNLPVMPWRQDDEGNDTLISIFDKNARTSGQFTFVESSEWQLSNAMPNFRTPLLVPVGLPIVQTDLIKIIAYDAVCDDAHIIGSVVVRAEFFMKNAGHEMMVKLKHSTNRSVDDLLQKNNTYLLLTSTCKTGGVGGGGRAASRAPLVAPTTRQQFGSVLHEFQTAMQKGSAAKVALQKLDAGKQPAPLEPVPTVIPFTPTTGEEQVEEGVRRTPAPAARQSVYEAPAPTTPTAGRARDASVQMPRTVLSFLQAGEVFTFYPPRRPIEAASRPLDAPCKVTVRLHMKGAFGHLIIRAEAEDDGSDDEGLTASPLQRPTPSPILLSIPFELVFQAKIGVAPGCFHLPSLSHRRPRPNRCLSLVIKTGPARDAKVAYWLDLESRSHAVREAWAQAVTEVNAYIHTPLRKAPVPARQAIEVDGVHSPVTSEPSSPVLGPSRPSPPLTASLPAPLTPVPEASLGSRGTTTSSTASEPVALNWEASVSGRSTPAGSVDGFLSTAPRPPALSFLDPPPAQRSAVDLARKLAKTLGTSNVLHDPQPPSTRDLNPAEVPMAPPIAPPGGAVGGEEISDGVPVAPAMDGVPMAPGMGPGPAPVVRTGPRLRRLHWYTVDGDGVEGTLWSERDEDVDGPSSPVWGEGEKLLVSLFSLAEVKTGAGGVGGKGGKAKEEGSRAVAIFDSKRAQNIEIALRAFRMPNSALHEAVVLMDMTILNAERLASLMQCCPTAEEAQAMRRWELKQPTADYTSLPKAEQFAFLMATIPHYQLRLRSMLFRLRYSDMVDGLVKQFGKLSRACRVVRESHRFRRVLRLILSVGNVMNRSGARGFHLTTLDELARTKSGDGNTNLLDFIISYLHLLHQRKGEAEDALDGPYLAELSPALSQVTLIDVGGLQDERAVIVQGLEDLKGELDGLREERAADPSSQMDGDEFVEQMGDFVEEAQAKGAVLQEQWGDFEAQSADLLSYLNEVGELSVSEVFALLARFSDALAAAEVRRQEKVKKDEAAAASAKHRRMQTEPPPASSLASVIASASVQQAMREHADKMKNATWDD